MRFHRSSLPSCKMSAMNTIYAKSKQTQDPPALLARLTAAGSDLGYQLTEAFEVPLRIYLRDLIPPRNGLPASRHLQRMTQNLAETLERQGHSDVDSLCSQFMETPVIQQADHSNLLLDEETLLNNLLFAVACREAGVDWMITSQCSTVSCLSRRNPVAGPVFLRTRGRQYNVFSLSKRTYKNASFCALPGPLAIKLKVISGNSLEHQNDPLLDMMQGRSAEDAPRLYRICNDKIWSALDDRATVPRVGVDEAMTSHLAASHIEDPHSPLHRLLFEAPVRDCFIRIKQRLVNSSRNLCINRATPDFFWYRKAARLVPVILVGNGKKAHFVLESGEPLPIAYNTADITAALRDGHLFVDRIIAYFIRCLLPGVTAVGGTSQQDYVALYQKMMLACQKAAPFMDEEETTCVSRAGASRLGGAPLLELDGEQREILAGLDRKTSLDAFLRPSLERTVGETIGNFDCARYFEATLNKLERQTI